MIKIKAINIHQIQKIPSIALFIKLNNFLSFVVRALNHKIYLLNKFQLYNAILLNIGSILYVDLQNLLRDTSSFPPPPSPGSHYSTFYEFDYFKFS